MHIYSVEETSFYPRNELFIPYCPTKIEFHNITFKIIPNSPRTHNLIKYNVLFLGILVDLTFY